MENIAILTNQKNNFSQQIVSTLAEIVSSSPQHVGKVLKSNHPKLCTYVQSLNQVKESLDEETKKNVSIICENIK